MSRIPLLALLLVACAAAPARPTAAAVDRRDHATAVSEAGAHWQRRAEPAQVEAALAAWRRAVELDPGDAASWLAIARGEHFLASSVLLFTDDRRALADAHARGAAAAEAGLRAVSPRFAELRRLDTPLDEAARVLGRAEVPLLYWWAQNTILWANAEGLSTTIRHHERVFRVMERVASLDPDYWYAGADRYFGTVFAAAPAIAGGDLGKSRAHFEAALARAPEYLETWVLYAQLYARTAGDRALYQRLLDHVLATPTDEPVEIAPEQAVARRQAALLRERSF